MKTYITFLFICVYINVFSQSRLLTIEEQHQDLQFLVTQLKHIHPSLYRYTTKEEFDELVKTIEAKIVKEESVVGFSNIISPVFYTIRDAHTWQRCRECNSKSVIKLPLEVKIIADRLYVYRNLSSNPKITAGKEIISLNGIPASLILNRLYKTISVDGYIETTAIRVLEEWFRHLYKVPEGMSNLPIELKSNSQKVSTSVIPLTEEEILNTREKKNYNIEDKLQSPYYDFTINRDVAILTINSFTNIPWGEYQKFIDTTIHDINQKNIQSLILDLRWNTGGPRDYSIYLYSRLTGEPFTYCKKLVATQATYDLKIPFDTTKTFQKSSGGFYDVVDGGRGLGEQLPHEESYKGKVFVLVDGQTNSSASAVASLIKSNQRGIIIGEETGGVFNGGTGEYHYVTDLPNSKITVQIPRYRVVLDVEPIQRIDRGVFPIYEVKYSIDDILNQKDLALEKAYKLITNENK